MQKLLLLLIGIFLSFSLFSQTTYVSQTAAGSGDGTSWENAFTSLDAALASAQTGDIWVAEGVYTPAGGTIESSFEVRSEINLYGSFAGTETSIDERVFGQNETMLSGDFLDNDMDFDSMSISENAQTVVWIDSLLDNIIIDGFHITDGNASPLNETPDGIPLNERVFAGGGIFSYSTLGLNGVRISNCSGRRGGGITISGGVSVGGDNSTFNMISVTNCRAFGQSVIFISGKNDCSITNSEFFENNATRGCVYPLRNNNFTLSQCSFRDNNDDGGWGGALFSWNNTNLLIENVEFLRNTSLGSGGVSYLDGREDEAGENEADNVIFRNCSFMDNSSSNFGGALYTWQMSMTLENCIFDNNVASTGDAGALACYGNTGKTRFFEFNEVTFKKSQGNFGGALVCGGEGATFTFNDCMFDDNNANVSGGSMLVAFGGGAIYNNCTFLQDSATFGGSLAFQNNGSSVLRNSSFTNGRAESNGGSINTILGHNLSIDQVYFELNSAGGNGGVINATNDSGEPIGDLSIENSEFYFNSAVTQGGVINLGNHSMQTNSSIYGYNIAEDGAGGVISANGSDSFFIDVSLINNTLFSNQAGLGGAVGAFTDGTETAGTTVRFQNNILDFNDPNNVETEEGTPVYISNGGNLSTDDSTDDFLTATGDISDGDDPEFVDPDDINFYLNGNSPAIDIGVLAGAPETDLAGAARIGAPDAGALEFDATVDVDETLLENDGLLSIKPNPVSHALLFELDNTWIGDVQAEIINIQGITVLADTFNKNVTTQKFQWNVSELRTGFYMLIVRNNKEVITAKMIKH